MRTSSPDTASAAFRPPARRCSAATTRCSRHGSECGELPFAFAVWAAHGDTDPDTVEALQHALTYGLERSYEAVLSSPFASDPQRGYDTLSHFDYIFDNQKNQALRKFWDSGVKVA